ncbi:hypothetical protein [Vibrio vulnificus]|uniref:hypothetical protein n=1 Tax=Vibrio vulnificus TaxID=672 RepID=UPI00051D055A|nr:hypothetical protein [Vibrio vulnificus]KGK69278.1 hypothetical protein NA76_16830 [Vibrio vulnificus]
MPQRYHDALAEMKKPGYVIGGEELNNAIEEPVKPENSFVVVDDNPFENEGETPETPKNEGETQQEPKQQEQQVDDNPFEGENAVNESEQPQEPENQIVDDNPFVNESDMCETFYQVSCNGTSLAF